MKTMYYTILLISIFLFLMPASALTIDQTEILETGDTEFWSPAWSPDGNYIAYVSYDSSKRQQIFTINIDGSGKKQLTDDPYKKWSVEWINEGIVFLSYDIDGLEKIFIIKPDGSERRKLIDENVRQGRAPWDKPPLVGGISYDSNNKKVLFTSYNDRSNEKIYEVTLDGSGKKQLINDSFRQWNPSFSPDGNSFVYVSYDDNLSTQLFIANSDGNNKKQITFDNIKKSDPRWGNDGILFVSYDSIGSSGEKIFIINPDGTEKKIISDSSFKQKNPRWSYDATKIIYEDTDQGELKFKIIHLKKSIPILTPIPTQVETPKITQTPQETKEPIETPIIEEKTDSKNDLNGIVFTIITLIGIIVVLMYIYFIIIDISKKK